MLSFLNPRTSVNIKPYLRRYKSENSERISNCNYFFEIHTQNTFPTSRGDKEKFQFYFKNDCPAIGIDTEPPPDKKIISISPETHMRDFEMILLDPPQKIARGQGICIIYFEEFNQYFKFVYEKEKQVGVNVVDGAYCLSVESFERFLKENLSSGWSFFIVKKDGKVDHLCEEEDERDKRESVILFSEFEDMKSYKHIGEMKRKVEEISDEEESIEEEEDDDDEYEEDSEGDEEEDYSDEFSETDSSK